MNTRACRVEAINTNQELDGRQRREEESEGEGGGGEGGRTVTRGRHWSNSGFAATTRLAAWKHGVEVVAGEQEEVAMVEPCVVGDEGDDAEGEGADGDDDDDDDVTTVAKHVCGQRCMA